MKETQQLEFWGKQMSKLAPLLETARQILTEAKKPLHVNDIASIAVSSNRNMQLDPESFAKKLSASLSVNVKSKSPRFSKIKNKNGSLKRGVYKVKNSSDPSIQAIKKKPLPPAINTNFMGKAGEYAVMAEMLFWGFNVSLMSVDEGIDVVASKAGHYFHIQVKTASENEGRFGFKIDQAIFSNNHSQNTFYVFVMKYTDSIQFAVIPSSHINHLRTAGAIAGTKALSINIMVDPKRKLFRMNDTDINTFINHFGGVC